MIDILFAAVPFIDTREPLMAPGLLKAVANAEGFSSMALDLNIETHHRLQNHPLRTQLLDVLTTKAIQHDLAHEIYDVITYCGDRILEHNPRIVGLSLLCEVCQAPTVWLTIYLKQMRPDIQILIGGSGIKDFIALKTNNYCEGLKKIGLIDHYILGDGEIALKEFLHGNLSYPGIDTATWTQPMDISSFPFPDYSDYNWDQYDDPNIPLCDSRGCVRTCTFCDIIEHWKHFVYRSADNTFAEMLHQIKKHGILNFSLKNSLSNGSMKEFNRWLDLVAEYNQGKSRVNQIAWRGYFIIREPHQHPEELWSKLANTNADLMLGVESLIHHVRWEMKKKFTNEAIDYHLEMGQKYHVPLNLLMIVGAPSETLDDYEFTKQWFRDRLRYAGNSVTWVNLSLASILPGTEWDRQQKKQFAIIPGNFPSAWRKDSITPEYRANYWQRLHEICAPFNDRDNRWVYNAQTKALSVMGDLH